MNYQEEIRHITMFCQLYKKVLSTVPTSTLTYWSFTSLLFLYVPPCGANRSYARLSLSHDFEQLGPLHMCTPRKDIGRSGTRTRYPRALSQPRYQ